MAAVRCLYADLDGTLLGPGGSLFRTPEGWSPRAAEALTALRERDVDLVLVSGRTIEQMREATRVLAAAAFIAELGAFVVERAPDGRDAIVANLGSFRGPGSAFEAIGRSGAGGFLLERYAGRLEPHAPWAFHDRRATMLFRGFLDPEEANASLDVAGYGWLELLDNGRISRRFETLAGLEEVRAYHLVPRGVNKASAVRLHRERAGLAQEQCAAVGDSASDLLMAPEVGALFLVGSSEPPAGTPRNVVTVGARAGDGFAAAVERLLS